MKPHVRVGGDLCLSPCRTNRALYYHSDGGGGFYCDGLDFRIAYSIVAVSVFLDCGDLDLRMAYSIAVVSAFLDYSDISLWATYSIAMVSTFLDCSDISLWMAYPIAVVPPPG